MQDRLAAELGQMASQAGCSAPVQLHLAAHKEEHPPNAAQVDQIEQLQQQNAAGLQKKQVGASLSRMRLLCCSQQHRRNAYL